MLISLYAVLRIIGEIIGRRNCIDDKMIRQFMLNRLTDSARRKIITHLGTCKKCSKRLEEYNFVDKAEDSSI